MLGSLLTNAASILQQTMVRPLQMKIKEKLALLVGRSARMSVDSKYTVVCTADKLILFRPGKRLSTLEKGRNEEKESTVSRPSSSQSMEPKSCMYAVSLLPCGNSQLPQV